MKLSRLMTQAMQHLCGNGGCCVWGDNDIHGGTFRALQRRGLVEILRPEGETTPIVIVMTFMDGEKQEG